ncbi:MAG: hypothetical protein ORN52_11995 [Beijerinckiaceae bacterium]|nr:hypothetical protein [Beijerinckiaceae bacterium]
MFYTYWHNALQGQFGPIHENDPQCGYYRMRWRRGGDWIPVAIFREDDGEVLALCKGEMKGAFEVWTWCCRYPVDYEVYRAVAEEGKPWPDNVLAGGLTDRVAKSSYQTTGNPSPAPFPTIGHNSTGVTEAEGLLEEIEALKYLSSNWLEEIGAIATQTDADRAANYAERFGMLESKAEALRTSAKRPVLEEGRRIDAEWKPVIARASDNKAKMKKALEPYLLSERERILREQAEREAALIAKGVEGSDPSNSTSSTSSMLPPRAGTHGRRIGLRSKKVVSVIDEEAFVNGFKSNDRFWQDQAVRSSMLKLAESDLIAGHPVPGAELIEQVSAA